MRIVRVFIPAASARPGACANRARRLYRPAPSEVLDERSAAEPIAEPSAGEEEFDDLLRERRRSRARLLASICEVDPLVCPRYGDELKVTAVLTASPA